MPRGSIFILAGVLLSANIDPCAAEEPGLKKINLFEAGTDGYRHYRIPGVIV